MSPQAGVPVEEYLAGVLRRHRDSMTRPDFQAVADDCGLYATQVQAAWEQLLAGRPLTVPTPSTGHPVLKAVPPALARSQGQPVEGSPSAWQAAKDHPSPGIRRKYQRAVDAIADLERALTAESDRDKLRARKQRLQEQLAKVNAELKGTTPTPGTADPVACPKCAGTFAGTHALAMHRSRKPACR